MKHLTKEGERLDMICKAHYGRESAVHDVLEANRHLAKVGPVLPAGLIIDLPELQDPVTRKVVRLWD